MAAAQAGAPLASHGVNLVDKHDGGSGPLGLLEQVPHPAGAHAHVQLHKVTAGDGQEAHSGLPRHSFRQQGLAGAGRAYQKDALGNPRPQGDIFLRVLQEAHDFPQFLLLLVGPCHILKRDFLIPLGEGPGAGHAEPGHPVRATHAAHTGTPAHQEVPHHADQRCGQNPGQEDFQPVDGVVLVVVIVGDDAPVVLVLDQLVQVVVEQVKVVQLIADDIAALLRLFQPQNQHVVLHGKGLHLLLQEQIPNLGVLRLGPLAAQLPKPAQAQQARHSQKQDGKLIGPSCQIDSSVFFP